jgi:hypothetical protein
LISTVALFVVPTVAMSWLFAGREKPSNSKFAGFVHVPDPRATVIGLIVLLGLPFVVEAARLAISGRCAMLEITILCGFRNLGLGLARERGEPSLEQTRLARCEPLRTGSWRGRSGWLGGIQHRRLFRILPGAEGGLRRVGVFLRGGNLTAYRRMKARVFRDGLEFLKHAVEEGDRDETREYIGLVNRAYGRMRLAYLQ